MDIDGVSEDRTSHSYRRNTVLINLNLHPVVHVKMLLSGRMASQASRTASHRSFSTIRPRMATSTPKKRRVEDEIHRPSLSGSSVGHLFSEINAMRPGMEVLRADGMSEDQRTYARKTATWLMGVPVLLGTLIVGGNWIMKDGDDATES